MADSALRVELVAADRVVWSGEASRVLARTVEGDLGILAGHAPLLSLLVPGIVEIESGGDIVKAVVGDGFLSVADNRISVLSEDSALASEIDPEVVQAELQAAQAGGNEAAIAHAEAKLRAVTTATR